MKLFVAGLMSMSLVGCVLSEPIDSTSQAQLTNGTEADSLEKAMASLRKATARYQNVDAAIADGYQYFGCFPGMGVVYNYPDRVGDGEWVLEEPEALFYHATKGGDLVLYGSEPAVVQELWGPEPPYFFDLDFHANDAMGLYGLHMWPWAKNPNGDFAFAHPKLTCEYAE